MVPDISRRSVLKYTSSGILTTGGISSGDILDSKADYEPVGTPNFLNVGLIVDIEEFDQNDEYEYEIHHSDHWPHFSISEDGNRMVVHSHSPPRFKRSVSRNENVISVNNDYYVGKATIKKGGTVPINLGRNFRTTRKLSILNTDILPDVNIRFTGRNAFISINDNREHRIKPETSKSINMGQFELETKRILPASSVNKEPKKGVEWPGSDIETIQISGNAKVRIKNYAGVSAHARRDN